MLNWPVVGIHVALLPNGNVLARDSVGARATETFPVHDFTRATIYDPATGTHTPATVNTGYNVFCAGFAHLSDGTVFLAGGNKDAQLNGIIQTHLFNPANNAWSLGPNMAAGRWYPSVTPLTNGEMLITEGGPDMPEVRRTDGTLRALSTASLDLPLYPWLDVAPDGRVFYSGPDQTMRKLDPAGGGSWQSFGQRDSINRSYGSHAVYDVGKTLVAGGGSSSRDARVIDTNGATPSVRTLVRRRDLRHLRPGRLPSQERGALLAAVPVQEGRFGGACTASADHRRPRHGRVRHDLPDRHAERRVDPKGRARAAGIADPLGRDGAALPAARLHRRQRQPDRDRARERQHCGPRRLHVVHRRLRRRPVGGEDGHRQLRGPAAPSASWESAAERHAHVALERRRVHLAGEDHARGDRRRRRRQRLQGRVLQRREQAVRGRQRPLHRPMERRVRRHHTLTARATDNAGATTTSAAVTISVKKKKP